MVREGIRDLYRQIGLERYLFLRAIVSPDAMLAFGRTSMAT